MDLKNFDSDASIINYLKTSVDSISTLYECRLYREEQLQLCDEVIHHRNCVEWIIRANRTIKNIKYALAKCIYFSEKMVWPLEDSSDKEMYSYYLEDAVFRDISLWDIFKQYLNEYYDCGCSIDDNISIFSFIRNKLQNTDSLLSNNIQMYLNSDAHQTVRSYLRNSFTHSLDSTSSYVLHKSINGKMTPVTDYLLPMHPFENINNVVNDITVLINFMESEINKLKENLKKNLALYDVSLAFSCGKQISDEEAWNLCRLEDDAERVLCPCQEDCANAHQYNGQKVCKPVKIEFSRINSNCEYFCGSIDLHMSFSEMKEAFEPKA